MKLRDARQFHGAALACVVLCLLLSSPPAYAALTISEFLAANDGLLQDEDLQSPDWIEIHNSGPGTVNLGGWHLTDDAGDLTQWTFPSTNLPAGQRLVVFASGKNRTVAGRELHANFQLDNDGEYLALVQPGGTVAHAYSPAYPNQRANVSYGAVSTAQISPFVASGADARVYVPSNGALDLTWTARTFDDSGWLSANTPVGFAVGVTNTTVLAIDVNDRDANIADTAFPGFQSFVINSNGGSATIQTLATTRSYGGITVTVTNLAPYGYDDRLRDTPTDNGAFTESLLLRDFLFSRDNSGTGGLDITIDGLAPGQQHQLTVWSYDTGSTGTRVSDWTANGATAINDYSFTGAMLPTSNTDNRFTFDAIADGSGRILLSGRRDMASTTFGVFFNALQVQAVLSQPGDTNELAAVMLDQWPSAYVRIPFAVINTNGLQSLTLRMKYDDGFVAYINGQQVASRNAPGSPQWNSTATAARSDVDNLVYEEIIIPNSPGLLVNGTNVLAIHGMNVNNADADFLVLPELYGNGADVSVERYFTPPTPGTPNGTPYLGLVKDTKFSVDRGFYDTPFTVAITSATTNALIYWTTNGSVPSPVNGTLYTAPVPVNGTTLLRAAAFLDDYVPSEPDTHTYLFIAQVLQQPNSLPGYPTVWQANYPADYEMDPNVVNHPTYSATISNDLRAIPTISLVSSHDSFWSSTTGIYPDAQLQREIAASAELFNGDNTSEFQINCALEMQGAASRDNVRLAKHSFRLKFRGDFGPSKLDYDWFPGPVNEFDNIVLRACFTDSWPTRSGGGRYNPKDALYLRDVWVKDTMRAMGHLAGRGSHVHLYVNGLYWGLYNPTERLDISFFSQHLGGYEKDWDVWRDFGEFMDGDPTDWLNLMALVNAGITSEAIYQQVAAQVDIDNLIDYMLLHIFAEAEDWPSHNWYAAHRRANPTNGLPATKWIFLPWDQEITIYPDGTYGKNKVNVSNDITPARIYSQLRNWPEFRVRFGDRVQKHLFNDGALAASNNVARLQGLGDRIYQALVGESARWGDAREFTIDPNPGHGQTYTRDEWWVPEFSLTTNYLAGLNAVTISRLRAADLYPTTGAPVLSQFGGAVSNGFSLDLSHTNATGAIFYTVDGSDPRVYGTGAVAPGAQSYEEPILFNGPTAVRARFRTGGGEWSALVEAVFFPPQDLSTLALTELMYNPPDLGAIPGNNLEFLELKNTGTNTLDLSGLTFSSGINFTFPIGTLLAPGEFFVLARNAVAFAAKYPGVDVNGTYIGQLDNAGEELTLSHTLGGTIFSVTYDDRTPWPAVPDLADFSLVPREPGQSQAPDRGFRWRASALTGGSPGADDPSPVVPEIVIDEILTHTDPPQKDAIELHNPTASTVNVGGWFLTDEPDTPKKFRIPDDTIIPAGGRIYFDEDDFNPTPGVGNSFAISSEGDELYLFSADAAGNFTGYDHGVEFGGAFNGVSFGRYVNSAGEEFHPPQISLTLGATNTGPLIGPVVISEIHYHPDIGDDEFLELLNITGSPVRLFNLLQPTNAWRINGIGFDFPANVTLDANAALLVVATNPATFRAKYNVPTNVMIFGPFIGALDNGGENIELRAPDNLNTNGVVPYVVVDAVRYNDGTPWPPAADGGGPSLQRVPTSSYGNEPLNWIAAAPTPGAPAGTGDSDGDGMPDWWEEAHGTLVFVSDADDDSDNDGLTNLEEFLAGTHPNDPASVLELSVLKDAGGVVLEFPAVSNLTYSIFYKPSLQYPWLKLADISAAPTNRMLIITNTLPGDSIRFFRLATPMQP